jgi:hypothetical protein
VRGHGLGVFERAAARQVYSGYPSAWQAASYRNSWGPPAQAAKAGRV